MLNTEGFNWTSYARTNVGKVRKVNEDSVLDHGDAGIWVVADGMGGHAAGDVASTAIVDKLAKIEASADANELIEAAENGLLEVNESLIQQAMERTDRQTMGSTVAVLVAFHDKCFTLWAGDSRVYRVRNGQLERITCDHSKVQDLVDDGLITEEEAERHPEANVITRAIGASRNLFIDLDIHDVKAGDRYMVCSDGLYKEVMDEELTDLISLGSPEEACNALVDLTLERGSRDNVTVIVVQAE
ncbi:MAG: protein phosphatase 2C domain-containing protein [Gammaproteobacteria bacterium]|nr:protein phosphatase 2C domain-containing protein [Gammaproteobacteria bacterium]